MKTNILYIISLLLLCVSCNVEQKQQLSYVEGSGGHEYRMHEIRIPENWKIVDAELDFRQLNLEFDRGNGIEKQSLKYPYRASDIIDDYYEFFKFRGANRLAGRTLLHFSTDEDPQSEFNPPIGTSKISSGIKEREEFAIYRTSRLLVIHFSIKNTALGNLTSHDLTKRYAKGPHNRGETAYFEIIDGKMHYNIVLNNKETRSFLIDDYYKNETYNGSGESNSISNNEVSWTWSYRITSKHEMDR